MGKIKILIVAAAMDVGGIENQLMHLLRKCDKQKFQIDFTSTDSDAHYLPEIRALGGQVHLIPRAKTQGFAAYCLGLWNVLKDGGYDVIHSHELFHSGIVKINVTGRENIATGHRLCPRCPILCIDVRMCGNIDI